MANILDTDNPAAEEKVTPDFFDEVTYEHEIYKGIGIDNPALGYVWVVLPSYAKDIKDLTEFNQKFIDFNQKNKELKSESYLYTKPQNLISFEYKHSEQGFGNFVFQLYDPTFTEIETKLLENNSFIAFQYGYGGSRDTASPWVFGMITGISEKFALEGTYITFTGIAQGWALNVAQKPIAYADIDKDIGKDITNPPTISEFVKSVALKAGFKEENLVIEPTLEIVSRGVGLNDNNPLHVKFSSEGSQTTFDHIVETLLPVSKSAITQNSGGYCFFVDQTTKGPVLHFHTRNYQKVVNKQNPIRLFTMFKSPNTVVREFNPDWNVGTVNIRSYNKLAGVGYDPINKIAMVSETGVRKPAETLYTTTGNNQSKQIDIDKEESVTYLVPFGGVSKDQLETELNVKFETSVLQANQATIEIQGTHQIRVLDTIAVHVYIPKGDQKYAAGTKNQQVHWISGKFLVQQVTHSIAKGDFKTKLDLVYSGRRLLVGKDNKVSVGQQVPAKG
jgi:hypothetical protein